MKLYGTKKLIFKIGDQNFISLSRPNIHLSLLKIKKRKIILEKPDQNSRE